MEKMGSKIINILKYILFIIKLILWVLIVILSFGFALMFIPEDKQEWYESDDNLMKEWEESEKKK
ncbi:hypothetical protein LCGC14_0546560 [marine sediment metagenome]|uniref:Uncharacterized protein n=1 Tax=marine sediment metagenome TaxID=412755 RepID=A0A0F9UCK0_9ZZZZ